MKAKFTLQACVGKNFVNVEFKKGKAQPVPNASSYWIRGRWDGKRERRNLGKDFDDAVVRFQNEEAKRQFPGLKLADSLQPATPEKKEEDTPGQSLAARVDAFLEATRRNAAKSQETYDSYRYYLGHLTDFAAAHPFQFPAGLTPDVLISYRNFLQTRTRKKKQLSQNTVHIAFVVAGVFLSWCGLSVKVPKGERTKAYKRPPEQYSDEELRAFFAGEDGLLWECFLCTGMRRGEMAHALYGDIDSKTGIWRIIKKPQFNWKPKRGKERKTPCPHWLAAKLQARMAASGRSKTDLIFFDDEGKPDYLGILRKLKKASAAAGIAFDGRVDVHKFRASAISRWLEDGADTWDVMRWVGHSDPAMILHYKAELDLKKKENHARATKAFAAFASKPRPVAAD